MDLVHADFPKSMKMQQPRTRCNLKKCKNFRPSDRPGSGGQHAQQWHEIGGGCHRHFTPSLQTSRAQTGKRILIHSLLTFCLLTLSPFTTENDTCIVATSIYLYSNCSPKNKPSNLRRNQPNFSDMNSILSIIV